jgi:prepilin-type N-terminal cleavage/methylation domain-containing protein
MKSRGFTLIELLFVVAILGLLSTTGILLYQQRMQNQKIEKTVAQMNLWLQAGMAYYVRYKKWPQEAQAMIAEGYMPKGARSHNPWCNTGSCYEIRVPQGDQLFTVVATINAPFSIREAIAAHLPYGKPEGTTVTGTVNVPLAGVTDYLDIIITNIVPYTLDEKDFLFWGAKDPPKDTAYDFRIFNIPVQGKIPACTTEYGKNYRFVSYATVTEEKTKIGTQAEQRPVITTLYLNSTVEDGRVVLNGWIRPQEYWALEPTGAIPTIKSEVFKELAQVFEVKGLVFFLCCKEGTACV